MKRFRAYLAVLGTVVFLAASLAGCGTSGKREGQVGTSVTSSVVVQKGDPVLAAAPGYVGSEACAPCHPNNFEGWGKSLHNAPLKTVAELGDAIFVNNADGNGQDDFKDTLDFNNPVTDSLIEANANGTALKASRPNAPILKIVNGKRIISIAGVEFEVQRTQGGNGFWKQRYHTKVGKSYYISPVQYNEISKKYEAYNPTHWYSGTPANIPRYTQAYGTDNLVAQFGQLGATGTNGTQRSWENRCAGCHQTGLTASAETTNYGGTNVQEAVTGYSELNIGCESCHGPGAVHVATRNPANIINPDNFKALGVVGLRAANLVCGACHHRGEGNATILSGTSPLHLEYPGRFVSGNLEFPLPGKSVVDNTTGNPFVVLNTTSAYYGVPTLRFFTEYDGWYTGYNFPTYLASLQHHQQWTDIEQGPHSADGSGTTCWSCHDPHEGKGDHQVRNTVTVAGTTLDTNNDDNSLCLACHAAYFGLTLNDVKLRGATVANAVLSHMGKEAVMGPASRSIPAYDPTGTGFGRCSKCHMPKTSSSAIRTAIGGGVLEGDIHNHTFNLLWPSVNVRVLPPEIGAQMANACYTAGCHNPGITLGSHRVISDWSKSGHADFTGLPFRDWDEDGAVPTSCAKCHSKDGFNDFASDGTVNSAAQLGTVISCGTCHTEEGDGTTLWDKRTTYAALSPVKFPSGRTADLGNDSNICMACHQGRASKIDVDNAIATDNGANTLTFVNNHYFAASATLFGTDVLGGYEYGDNVYVGRFAHISARDTCIECHMGRAADINENNHTFEPKTTYCLPCHTDAVNNPSDPANPFRDIRFTIPLIDFDGDGNNTEGIYFEIWDTLVPALYAQIQDYAGNVIGTPIVYQSGVYPYFFKDTNANGVVDAGEAVFGNRYNVFDAKLLKAAYNYGVVQNEPCGYIHNAKYHIQLLYDSTNDLGGAAAVAGFTRP